MKLAVCLLTADRAHYTARTLESFTRHNPCRDDLIKLHADDGSSPVGLGEFDNFLCAKAFGFETFYATPTREGAGRALSMMWNHAVNLGATHILHLENDWETVAPLPRVTHRCVRLYGAQKARSGPRSAAGGRDMTTGAPVRWHAATWPGWEASVIHWGGPPSITEAGPLLEAVQGAARIKDICQRLSLPTMRPVENIVWHIGKEQTPDFVG